jgi:hypothetical protein
MSAIPALFQRFLRRLELGHAISPSSETTPAPSPALGDFTSAPVPTGAVCARCRRSLRRNGYKVRAGRARARGAKRDELGRFLSRVP